MLRTLTERQDLRCYKYRRRNLKCVSKYAFIIVNSTIKFNNNKKTEQTKQDRYFDETNEKSDNSGKQLMDQVLS